jgi:single-stranded-DNA-specific exonuclease
MLSDTVRRRQYDAQLAGQLHQCGFIGRVLAARGVQSSGDLQLALNGMLRPDRMVDLERAVALLRAAVVDAKRILIIGDYDADGATSTAIAVHALRAMGARHVDWLVPNRFEFGYGLSPQIVELAIPREPDLIVTVDNGVASHDGVAAARAAGIQVLVTDHHLPPDELPAADALVNPNRHDDQSDGGNLCGAGVIFYVLAVLCRRLGDEGWYEQRRLARPVMADYLDLVAIATVADVVPLDYNNRILVEQGLRRIRAGRTRPGVLALFSIAGRDHKLARAEDLGFCVGPRLNAAGRLDDISIGIECLLSEGEIEAGKIARQLDALNRQRRDIERGMREVALEQVDAILQAHSEKQFPEAISLYREDWHEGVVGIVAGRIREHCHRPVFAFAKSGSGELKGSGRSIPGVHLRDVLSAIAATSPGLLKKFGGHAMAAGLSLAERDLARFDACFRAEVTRLLKGQLPAREWLTDGCLDDDDFRLEHARELELLQPWGQGFPAPLFDDTFEITDVRPVGSNHSRLRLKRCDGGRELAAIAFNRRVDPGQARRWQVVYSLGVNRYSGSESLQLGVQYMAPLEDE